MTRVRGVPMHHPMGAAPVGARRGHSQWEQLWGECSYCTNCTD